MADIIIDIRGLGNQFDGHWVHRNLNIQVERGQIVGIVGGSGCGKTTLLRSILRLQPPTKGQIKVFDTDIWAVSDVNADKVRQRWAVLFQKSALFSSLSVLENILFPLKEFTDLPKAFIEELAYLKLHLVGLPMDAAHKMPSELSGGMQKRVAAARAIALDPELLFLDEPTAGLDPKSAEALDELILKLHEALELTIIIVTHDLTSLARITHTVAFMGDQQVLANEPLAQLKSNPHPLIQGYFK